MSVGAISTLHRFHESSASVGDAIERAGAQAGPSGLTDKPLVLSSSLLIPSIVWPQFEAHDWLVARPDVAGLVELVTRAGAESYVVVTDDPEGDRPALPVDRTTEIPVEHSRFHVFVVGANLDEAIPAP